MTDTEATAVELTAVALAATEGLTGPDAVLVGPLLAEPVGESLPYPVELTNADELDDSAAVALADPV